MILYHGSTLKIQKPSIQFAKKYLNFGPGMYFTTYQEQAETWAKRKALRIGQSPIINVYEIPNERLLSWRC